MRLKDIEGRTRELAVCLSRLGERLELVRRTHQDHLLQWMVGEILSEMRTDDQRLRALVPDATAQMQRCLIARLGGGENIEIPTTSVGWMDALARIVHATPGSVELPKLHLLNSYLSDNDLNPQGSGGQGETQNAEALEACRRRLALLLQTRDAQLMLLGARTGYNSLVELIRAISEAQRQNDLRFLKAHDDEYVSKLAYLCAVTGLAHALLRETVALTPAYRPQDQSGVGSQAESASQAMRLAGWHATEELHAQYADALKACEDVLVQVMDEDTLQALSQDERAAAAWRSRLDHLEVVQRDRSYPVYAAELRIDSQRLDAHLGCEGHLAQLLARRLSTLGCQQSEQAHPAADSLQIPFVVRASEPTLHLISYDGGAAGDAADFQLADGIRASYEHSVPTGRLFEATCADAAEVAEQLREAARMVDEGTCELVLLTLEGAKMLEDATSDLLAWPQGAPAYLHVIAFQGSRQLAHSMAESPAMQAFDAADWDILGFRLAVGSSGDSVVLPAWLEGLPLGTIELPLVGERLAQAQWHQDEVVWARDANPQLDQALVRLTGGPAGEGEARRAASLIVGTKALAATLPVGERELPLTLPWALDLRKGALLSLGAAAQKMAGQAPATDDDVRAVSHAIIWNFLRLRERMKVQVQICDFVNRGTSAAPFLEAQRLAGDDLFGDIVTNEDGLMALLRSYNERIDETTQSRLSADITNLVDYNERYPRSACGLTLLVIYDYPARMDQRVLGLLRSMIDKCGPCGISVLLVHTSEKVPTRSYDDTPRMLSEIDEALDHLEVCGSQLLWNGEGRYPLVAPRLPGPETVMEFVRQMHEQAERERNQSVSFDELQKLVDLPAGSGNSSQELSIPVGIGRGDEVAYVRLGSATAQHALIIGSTGSGKSSFFHTLILSGMNTYGPNQLQFYLMDFKGPEFKLYETHPVPHVRQIAIDAMQVFGEGVLESLVAQMEERNRLFKKVGCADLAGYLDVSGQSLPRIIVIMDEFQVLYDLGRDRAVARRCAQLTDDLVKKGRSAGIHLIMATQTLASAESLALERGTLEQLNVRIALRCGERDIRSLFGSDAEREAKALLDGPRGTVVMGSSNESGSLCDFRFVYLPTEKRVTLLEQIAARYADAPLETRVFEGGRTHALTASIPAWGTRADRQVVVSLAEQVKTGEALSVRLDRMQHNLLICGADEELLRSFCWTYALSALSDPRGRVLMVDGLGIVEERDDELARVLEDHVRDRFSLARDFDDLFSLVGDAYDVYEGVRGTSQEKTVLILKDVQLMDDALAMLKGERVEEPELSEPEEDAGFEWGARAEAQPDPNDPFAALASFLDTPAPAPSKPQRAGAGLNPTEKLRTLIEKGFRRGVVVVVASTDARGILELKYAGNVFKRLNERLIFAMSGEDASALASGLDVPSLDDGVAYFSDGKRDVQVLPYQLPTACELREWMEENCREGWHGRHEGYGKRGRSQIWAQQCTTGRVRWPTAASMSASCSTEGPMVWAGASTPTVAA